MARLIIVLAAVLALGVTPSVASAGMHDGHGVPPYRVGKQPVFMTEGGGGGGYPPLNSPCGGFAQGYCVGSGGKIVPCVCIKWEICGIWTFVWKPVNVA